MLRIVKLVILVLVWGQAAQAQVTTFSDRAAWNSAVGAAAIQTESLNGVVADTSFRGTAVALLNMAIEEINGPSGNSVANVIDASPFEEDGKRSPNGTTYVLGEVDDSGVLIRIDFASPVTGWGADFVSHDGSLVIDVFDQSNSLIGTTTSVALDTTFYGFHLGAGQTAKRIELKFVGQTNDLFGMDDLSFTGSSSPGPAEQITALGASVDALETAGTIDAGPANSLTRILDAAMGRVNSDPEAAVGMLSAFVRHVMALVRGGVLSSTDGQALVVAAQNAIAALLIA